MLFTNHQYLRYLNTHTKLNQRNIKWVDFFKSYAFVLNHKLGNTNKVVDALIRRFTLFGTTTVKSTGLESMKVDYKVNEYFFNAWNASKEPWSPDRYPYLDYFV